MTSRMLRQGVEVPAPPPFEDGALITASDFSIVQDSGVSLLDNAGLDGVASGIVSNQMSFDIYKTKVQWTMASYFSILAVGD